jgi:hypothetical protein
LLKRRLSTCLIGVVLLIALGSTPLVVAQSGNSHYFPETGHTVRDPFLSYYNTTGGLARYGYPITDEVVDPTTGLLVQYFQNARMELHPANPDPYKIQLGLLGNQLGKQTTGPIVSNISLADPNCYFFSETGHFACFEFLKYWRSNGGLDSFGYPITDYYMENGIIVQYFQRAKLEWHPEKPKDQRMQLAPLGSIYFDYAQLPRGWLVPTSFGGVTSIRARASVLESYVTDGRAETAYIYVTDQLGKPVPNAAVTLIIHHPSGDESFTLSPTTQQGTTFKTFNVGSVAPGTMIPVEFIVNYPGLQEIRTRTSYMVWFY